MLPNRATYHIYGLHSLPTPANKRYLNNTDSKNIGKDDHKTVSYSSWILSTTGQSYSQTKLEFFTIVQACEHKLHLLAREFTL